MNQFKSPHSFWHFSYEVKRKSRYVRTPEAEEFLRAVASTCESRIIPVDSGQRFFRAQRGNEWHRPPELAGPELGGGIRVPVPHKRSRMKPKPASAWEGRANPKGIPCLYLATSAETAMSEVRPEIGAYVSLATFEIVRPLRVVDCFRLHDQYWDLAFGATPPEKIDDVVWAAIDNAFAESVTRADDTADYAATQTIAELFRNKGYGGVAYKSAFGTDGYNLKSVGQIETTF